MIDANVMRLYDKPADPKIKALFAWVASTGVLAVSPYLIREYQEARNRDFAGLLLKLIDAKRLQRFNRQEIDTYSADRRFRYTCNYKDRRHARLVYLSTRKRLVSFDKKLSADVNRAGSVNGVRPAATSSPEPAFYL